MKILSHGIQICMFAVWSKMQKQHRSDGQGQQELWCDLKKWKKLLVISTEMSFHTQTHFTECVCDEKHLTRRAKYLWGSYQWGWRLMWASCFVWGNTGNEGGSLERAEAAATRTKRAAVLKSQTWWESCCSPVFSWQVQIVCCWFDS